MYGGYFQKVQQKSNNNFPKLIPHDWLFNELVLCQILCQVFVTWSCASTCGIQLYLDEQAVIILYERGNCSDYARSLEVGLSSWSSVALAGCFHLATNCFR